MKHLNSKTFLLFFMGIIFCGWFNFSRGNETQVIELKDLLVQSQIPQCNYQVAHTFPHNNLNFTEGLSFSNNYLYESTGLYEKSSLQKIDINTEKILQRYILPPQYFAEGITLLGDHMYQLTYKENTGFVYDKNTWTLQKTFHYEGEGWGLTNDNHALIMSNGTAQLTFLNAQTFKKIRTLIVTAGLQEINFLNELEYIHGKIYANVWPTSFILILSPQTGKVESWLNIETLKPKNCSKEDCVANGIAYRETDQTLLVTGKNWPQIYALKLFCNTKV